MRQSFSAGSVEYLSQYQLSSQSTICLFCMLFHNVEAAFVACFLREGTLALTAPVSLRSLRTDLLIGIASTRLGICGTLTDLRSLNKLHACFPTFETHLGTFALLYAAWKNGYDLLVRLFISECQSLTV